MRKLIALVLVFSLPVLVVGCGPGGNGNDVGAQEQVGELPPYGFESHVMPMAEVGRVLEQMGREMQQNGSATFLGVSYPLSGLASIEFGISRRAMGNRGLRTNFGVEFRSADEPGSGEQRPNGGALTYYEGRLAAGTPAEVADAVDQFAETLATAGDFAWDFHRAAFVGTAMVDQYLGQNTRNPRQPYRYMLDITFGEGEVQRHEDREDIDEAVESGTGTVLGRSSTEGVDRSAVVEALRGLSAALRAGEMVVGEGQAAVGEDDLTLSWAHVFKPGGSDKVEMSLNWPSLPPPEPEPEPEEEPARYYQEPTDMPVAELAALLQRIAAEILEDGTFVVEGQEYRVGETVGGEIGFTSRGILIDVGWRR